MRVSNSHIYQLEKHIARIKYAKLYLAINLDLVSLEKEIKKYATVSKDIFKMIVTAGNSNCGYSRKEKIFPIRVYFTSRDCNATGMRKINVDFAKTIRPSARIFPANFKSLGNIYSVKASLELKESLSNMIMLNEYGRVAEAYNANIFWVKNGKIFTPPEYDGAIAGVIKSRVIEKFEVIEKETYPEDLIHADEIFLTNISNLVISVSKISNYFVKRNEYAALIYKFLKTEIGASQTKKPLI